MEALQSHVAQVILHDPAMEDVFDAVRHPVHDDGDCLLGGLRQREWDVGEDVEGGRLGSAVPAGERRAHLPIEEEIDDGPIAEQAV